MSPAFKNNNNVFTVQFKFQEGLFFFQLPSSKINSIRSPLFLFILHFFLTPSVDFSPSASSSIRPHQTEIFIIELLFLSSLYKYQPEKPDLNSESPLAERTGRGEEPRRSSSNRPPLLVEERGRGSWPNGG
nr:hypothetical protein Itr_chr12CG16590 [Ipomoea trifida]